MIKSRIACIANVNTLSGNGRLYLWTFTTRESQAYKRTRDGWNKFLTYLKREFPSLSGIRVFEVHPGVGEWSHGVHIHLVTDSFLDVNRVRITAKLAGWGRVHVSRVKRSEAVAHYLAKYLTKEKRVPGLKGWRLWATFGGIQKTKVSDIECHSFQASCMRWLYSLPQEISFGEKQQLCNLLDHWSLRNGWNWPELEASGTLIAVLQYAGSGLALALSTLERLFPIFPLEKNENPF